MIVVTGATGNVGRELVAQLAGRGDAVRAVTRRPDAGRFPEGVEVAYGDFDDASSLEKAMKGADGAFLMSAQPPGSARHPTHDLHLVAAVRSAGVGRIVKLSVFDGGAVEDPIGAWTRETERAVTESGTDWTLLRPGRFMTNALQWIPMIRRGVVTVPFAHRPAAPIDPADIAAVAVEALTTGSHAGVAYQLSGPQTLTPADELAILAETIGRPLQLVDPDVDATRSGMVAAGVTPDVVDAILARSLSDDLSGAAVLPTVEEVLGRPAATFASWAGRHAHLFANPDHP
jgi:uncharacterized protein YbjT (DUF2867 family)